MSTGFNQTIDLPVSITLIHSRLFTVASLVCKDGIDSVQSNLLLTTPMTFNLPVDGSDHRSGPPESTGQELTLVTCVHNEFSSISFLYVSAHCFIGTILSWDLWRLPDIGWSSNFAVPQPAACTNIIFIKEVGK